MGSFKKVAFTAAGASLLITGLVLAQTSFAQSSIKALGRRNFNPPVVTGVVAAVNGSTINLTAKNGTVYTIDASKATVEKLAPGSTTGKPGKSTITVSGIQTGDTLMVFGTANGNSVVAIKIEDGQPGVMAKKPEMGRGVVGTVSAVSSNTLTVAGKNGTTYYVDASAASISKFTNGTKTSIQISGILTGDTVMVQGKIKGTNVVATQILDGVLPQKQNAMGKPAAFGTVTSVSGNTVNLTGKNAQSYIVDASNATIEKILNGTKSTITVSGIQTGDKLIVFGTVSGLNVSATQVIDGNFRGHMGNHGMMENSAN